MKENAQPMAWPGVIKSTSHEQGDRKDF